MRQPFSGTAERIFMKLLPNDSEENGVSIAVPKWGLGPRIIFWGRKTTQCALFACRYWCRRLTNDSELVYAGWVLYGGCVKRHERGNAFNLVFKYNVNVYRLDQCAA